MKRTATFALLAATASISSYARADVLWERHQYFAQGDHLMGNPEIGGPSSGSWGDRVGSAMASGDFNGDGYADLAIGAPGENDAAGRIHVVYGWSLGLDTGGPLAPIEQSFDQDSPDVDGQMEAGDFFGGTLASGDFNGDGYDDLAVGVPSETVGGHEHAGSVAILYGTANGLSALVWNGLLRSFTRGTLATNTDDAYFGGGLATGDFDGDGYADLAIGASGVNEVRVVFGSGVGLMSAGSIALTQDSSEVPGGTESGDQFGGELAAGDFDGDGHDDLAIGVPGESITFSGSSREDAGRVVVAYGPNLGQSGVDAFSQETTGVDGSPEDGDLFGRSLSAGDLNNDGVDDLAIGIVKENGFGAVAVLKGGMSVGLSATDDALWVVDPEEIGYVVTPDVGAGYSLAIGNFNGAGRREIVAGSPENEPGGFVSILNYYVDGGDNMLYTGNLFQHTLGEDHERWDYFGGAMAAGDFDGDGYDDLAVGCPGKGLQEIDITHAELFGTERRKLGSGGVYVLYGGVN